MGEVLSDRSRIDDFAAKTDMTVRPDEVESRPRDTGPREFGIVVRVGGNRPGPDNIGETDIGGSRRGLAEGGKVEKAVLESLEGVFDWSVGA